MYYLKCSNCGHLNQVSSEYMVFCTKCRKKLDNNFPNWKLKNPGKSFNDFKELVCLSESDLASIQPVKKKSKRKGLKYFIMTIILMGVFYGIGYIGTNYIIKYFKTEKTPKEILTQDWVRDTYGSYGLSVETPFRLTKGELPVPEALKQYVDQMDTYEYKSKKGFKVMINSIKYKPAAGPLSLQGAADGSVNEMKKQKGVSDLKYAEKHIFYNDKIPGFIQKGSYKYGGVEIKFINTGYMKGLVLWQVFAAYMAGDDVGRMAAERVINSIQISEEENTKTL